MPSERLCAKSGCPVILGPGGGVAGYCSEHELEAVIEVLEALGLKLDQLSERSLLVERQLSQVNVSLIVLEDLLRREQ